MVMRSGALPLPRSQAAAWRTSEIHPIAPAAFSPAGRGMVLDGIVPGGRGMNSPLKPLDHRKLLKLARGTVSW